MDGVPETLIAMLLTDGKNNNFLCSAFYFFCIRIKFMENSEFIPSGDYGKAESSDYVPNLWDKSGMN